MVEKIGHIKNPLTVIAIFAAIVEVSGTTVLPFIEPDNQGLYIWFLMLFPVFLVGLFFLTLNFNHKVLYAPSDYKNENNFLKSFGRATAEEREEKYREEFEETAEDVQSENTQDGENQAGQCQINYSKKDRHSMLMANVFLAERLAINKLSKDLNLDFKTDVRFETPSGRKIIFDGLALDGDKVHAAEIKLFRNEHVSPSRIDKVLLESEVMKGHLKGIDSKEFVLHFVAVIDNPEVDLMQVEKRLKKYISRYDANVRLHVVSLADLRNEYQYSP
ncbi:hypothetical protein [Halomonas mongoliensis]|uniref:hypothetical protein n=1 Tax=Halomonas mongoliensis TaxID=321265 RepID=UPI00403ADCFD